MDLFDVRFASTEKEFIYNFGVNRGHSLSYAKVNRCLFLSDAAKQLYHSLCDYAYGERKDCYPSQALLRLGLGWSKQTLSNHLKELEKMGFITIEKEGFGKPAKYNLQELHKIPALYHSEIIYSIRPTSTEELEKFYTAVAEYKKSDLCREVMESANPLAYMEQIKLWFKTFLGLDNTSNSSEEEKVEEVKEKSSKSNKVKLTTPKVFKVDPLVQEENPMISKKKRRRLSYKEIDVEDWNTNHFVAYFEDLYQEKYHAPYITTKADRGAMKRLLNSGKSKAMLKQHIENFISLDFFEAPTITSFSSSYVQAVLDTYLSTRRLPTFKRKSNHVGKINEEWARGLDELMDSD